MIVSVKGYFAERVRKNSETSTVKIYFIACKTHICGLFNVPSGSNYVHKVFSRYCTQ